MRAYNVLTIFVRARARKKHCQIAVFYPAAVAA